MVVREAALVSEVVDGEVAQTMTLLHPTMTITARRKNTHTPPAQAQEHERVHLALVLEISSKVGAPDFGLAQRLELQQVTSPAIAVQPVLNQRLSNVDLLVGCSEAAVVAALGLDKPLRVQVLLPHRSPAAATSLLGLEVLVDGEIAFLRGSAAAWSNESLC